LPPPLPGSETHPSEDPKFEKQFAKVLALSKKLKDKYSTGRGSMKGEEAVPYIERQGLTGGNWPLNGEVMKDMEGGREAESKDALLKEIEVLSFFAPCLYHVYRGTFMADDCGDGEYQYLEKEAKKGEWWAIARFAQAKMALHMLTMRLMDVDLFVEFPEEIATKTNRRIQAEKGWREIYARLEVHRSELASEHKRYETKAILATAEECKVSTTKVEDAKKFVEGDRREAEERWRRIYARLEENRKKRKERDAIFHTAVGMDVTTRSVEEAIRFMEKECRRKEKPKPIREKSKKAKAKA
jgi:hypothetical protein